MAEDTTKTTSNVQRGPQSDPLSKTVAKIDNPYEYNDDEKTLLGDFDLGSPIARAWSRFSRLGHFVGAPVGGMKTQLGVCSQSFQNAVALMLTDEKDNRNLTVQFYDARGLIGEENGL